MYDPNEKIPIIELMQRMPPEFKKVHAYAKDNLNIDLTTLVMPVIRNINGQLDKKHYNFNYENLTAEIFQSVSSDVVVAIYINRLLYESIKKSMKEDKNYFKSNTLTNIYITIGNEQLKVNVKSFINKRESQKQDILKSLRVQTPYGIGYISLIEDDNKDGYKICLGNDEAGKPIIRKFETV